MLTKKTAIFWDNDGVLVDTEKYYYEANRVIFENEGFVLTREMYMEMTLVKGTGAWHFLDKTKYTNEKIVSLKKERDELYSQLILSGEILMPGIEDVLTELSQKYKMAIVTSSKPVHFEAIHSRTGLLKYFEFVVTPNDYKNYKPHPEPYLTALARMGVKNTEGIAVEDSRRGLLSAKAAGLECIVVKNELTATSDFTEADCVVEEIREITNLI